MKTPLYLLLLWVAVAHTYELKPFPGSNGKNIGYMLPGTDTFQPSDLVWHARLQRLFVVSDRGYLGSMKSDGSEFQSWQITYLDWGRLDLEGVTVAFYDSNFIYLGVESPAYILEWDLTTHEVRRAFSLVADMGTSKSSGLEALTFVPDPSDEEGGTFYAGKQKSGTIYRYQLPILSSNVSTNATLLKKTKSNLTDVSGMDYNRNTKMFYMIYDTDNIMIKTAATGNFSEYYSLEGEEQEGIAFNEDATVFYVAWDGGPCADAELLFGYEIGIVIFILLAAGGSVAFIFMSSKFKSNSYVQVQKTDPESLQRKSSWRARLRHFCGKELGVVFAIILASAAISSGIGLGYGSYMSKTCGQIWRYDWDARNS